LNAGRPGVLHGNRTYLLQDANGQIVETHSVSAGLDYPGVGPEHAWLKDNGRAQYVTHHRCAGAWPPFTSAAASKASYPALESSHALAYARELAATMRRTRYCWSIFPAAATRT
jgi:tryptophan synthase beta chain